jgi:hypothetical protein
LGLPFGSLLLGRAGIAGHLDGRPGDDDQGYDRHGTTDGVGHDVMDRDNGRRRRDSDCAREEEFQQGGHANLDASVARRHESSMRTARP